MAVARPKFRGWSLLGSAAWQSWCYRQGDLHRWCDACRYTWYRASSAHRWRSCQGVRCRPALQSHLLSEFHQVELSVEGLCWTIRWTGMWITINTEPIIIFPLYSPFFRYKHWFLPYPAGLRPRTSLEYCKVGIVLVHSRQPPCRTACKSHQLVAQYCNKWLKE